MANVVLIADLDRFAMRDAYENILRANINPKSSYVPALHQMAEELRKLVRDLDHEASVSLARILSAITGARESTDCQAQLDELRATLETCGPDEARDLKVAIADLEQVAREAQEQFNKQFSGALKQIRENLYGFEESQFPKRFKDAFLLKRKELDQLALWSDKQLTPILRDFASGIASVDTAIAEIMNKNMFDKALELLPSSETVSSISLEAPEEGALKAGYEVVLSALNMLSEQQKLSDLIEKREDLIEKRNKLRELYDKARKDYDAVAADLCVLRGLWSLHENVVAYMAQAKKMVPPLEGILKRLEKGAKAPLNSGDYVSALGDVEGCLKQLNLIWR